MSADKKPNANQPPEPKRMKARDVDAIRTQREALRMRTCAARTFVKISSALWSTRILTLPRRTDS